MEVLIVLSVVLAVILMLCILKINFFERLTLSKLLNTSKVESIDFFMLFIGIAKPSPIEPPDDEAIQVLIPITSP